MKRSPIAPLTVTLPAQFNGRMLPLGIVLAAIEMLTNPADIALAHEALGFRLKDLIV